MPKARRARLTRKKQKTQTSAGPLGREKNAPTEEEWEKMHHYGGFSVVDTHGEEFQFEAGEVALVWPNGRKLQDTLALKDYWVCTIDAIRATAATNVWAKVRWFYAKNEARESFPDFDVSHLGDFERLESNHADCISSSVFDGKLDMKKFDESELYPEPIQDGELYFRYKLDVNTKKISPAVQTTCTCKRPYNPSDSDPGSLMHFCPRSSCQMYYHTRCVAEESAGPAAERDRGFLLLDPDSDDRLELEHVLGGGASASAPPKKKQRRANADDPPPIPVLGPASAQIFSNLPPALVKAAEQPIVRGAAFRAGGVVGNISAVMAARRLVYHSLQTGDFNGENWEENMPDRWQELVDVKLEGVQGEQEEEDEKDTGRGSRRKRKSQARCNGTGKAVASGQVLALNCPTCGGPI